MKTVRVELTNKMAAELEALVKGGWFAGDAEVIRCALIEFVARRFALAEQFQRDDVAWALRLARPRAIK